MHDLNNYILGFYADSYSEKNAKKYEIHTF